MRHENFTNVLRFGRFDLDLRSGELYSNGLKIQLQEQPFRILELLAKRSGELVTREEIRRRLWPNGTVVEFDNAVNVAMKKLRLALGDSAEQPHYIETIKRRGYRLIVPVEGRPDGLSDSGTSNHLVKDTEPSPFRPVQDLSGRTISHYQVLDLIGGGGMGVVYREEDIRLGRQVALKFLPDGLSGHPIALERLRLEARSASALNHPNICTIYEIGEDAGQPFIAMELLEGSTLRDRLSGTSLAPRAVLDYAFQIAEGLHAAHHKGIVHRDIKPANIFITTQPQEHAKILDFGLAKATTPPECAGQLDVAGPKHLTRPGAAAGTIAYMSPEQVLGKSLDARSDLFSFGVVLYEMATGKTPFSGVTDAAIFDAILHKTPISSVRVNPDISPGLDRIITKCLEKDRELRYRDASEIRDELQRLKRETDSVRLNPGTPAAVSTIEKRWSRIALAVAAVVLMIGAGYWYLHRTPKLTDKDNIVLADFINTTGEPIFEGTLRQGLAVQLGQSPFLSLVSEDRIQRTLRLMGQPVDAPITAELARDVCERTGVRSCSRGQLRGSEVATYWDYVPRTAGRGKSWMRSRHKQQGRKMSSIRSVKLLANSELELANR